MTQEELNQLIDNIVAIDNSYFDKGNLLIFKTFKPRENANPNINLNYLTSDVKMSQNTVVENTKRLMKYLKNNILKDRDVANYDINNPKKTIDIINMNNFDFSKETVANGTDPLITNLNSNSYKIKYFLNELKKNSDTVKKPKDFDKMRYTCTHASYTKEDDGSRHNIYIINKCKPLVKTEFSYFIFEPIDDKHPKEAKFDMIQKDLFKMPFYPSLLIIDNLAIFIDDKIESIFGFEEYNKHVAKDTISNLSNNLLVNTDTLSSLESLIKMKKYYNRFSQFDDTILNSLKIEDDPNVIFLRDKFKISIDFDTENNTNKITIDSKEKSINFIDFICGHIRRDAITETLYSVPKSTPCIIK